MDSNRDQHQGPTGRDRPPRRIQVRQTERGGRAGAALARPASTAERRGAPGASGGGVARPPAPPTKAAAGGQQSLFTRRHVVIGAGTLAALVCVLFIAFSRPGAKCPGTARLKGPEPGSAVRGEFKLGISVENRRCVSAVTYQVDGEDVATEVSFPYEAVLNARTLARKFPGQAAHEVTATIEDTRGQTHALGDKLKLTFGADLAGVTVGNGAAEPGARPEAPEPDPGAAPAPSATVAATAPTPDSRHEELSGKCEKLAGQISGKSGYTFGPEFTSLVEQRLGEYRGVRAYEMASHYRQEINKAFSDQNVLQLIGYIMAFSRSKFDVNESSQGVGLWQIPPKLARSSNYIAQTESDASLKDPKRSAEVAAVYMKSLLTTFETEDFMYAVACFGMSVNKAGGVSSKLNEVAPDPAARRDIVKMSKAGVLTPAQVDRVARFFAAGIIGEHQKDGKTFSSLYY